MSSDPVAGGPAKAPFVVCFSMTTTVYASSEQEAQELAWAVVYRSSKAHLELDIALEYVEEIPTTTK